MPQTRTVAILLFDEVEVLDFAGPFEVFSVTGRTQGISPFDVFTVAESSPVIARNGLSINPRLCLTECPRPDILVVPGGFGTRREMHNERLLAWIGQVARDATLILSVCTGALLLAKAGLLEGLAATTHFGAFELLRSVAPNTEMREGARIVDNGRVILSAGVSAGIDMSLHVVARLLGDDVARETARYIEYEGRADYVALERGN